MNDRATVLERIRRALGGTTDARVRGRTKALPDDRVRAARRMLPAVPSEAAGRCALFADRLEMLRAGFVRVSGRGEAIERIGELAREEGWIRVATHADALNDSVCAAIGADVLHVTAGYDRAALAQCDAGITRCEALIAQTGSVLVSSLSSGGRALTVLPPHHVVLATQDQLVDDLFAGYDLMGQKYGDDWPSMTSLITGPSRTGDIERTLVLGAHGPRQLTVVLLDEDSAE